MKSIAKYIRRHLRRHAPQYIVLLAAMAVVFNFPAQGAFGADGKPDTGFKIKGYEITGNTIFPADKLRETAAPFTGTGKTASDVEKARDAIEKLFHDAGYPAVMVNIPEQTLKDGIVKLEVIESRIGKVEVTGNRFFTSEGLLRELPALAPGQILYWPDVKDQIDRLNRNQDVKIEPVMTPGDKMGVVDVELKTDDRLPLHGYLEINNRNSPETKPLRLNAMVRYDNLWQRSNSIAFQLQTDPQDLHETGALGISYSLPSPLNKDHELVVYSVWSNSNVAFGEGFTVVGKGYEAGMRYAIPLPPHKLYSHNITLGVDYKHFNQVTGSSGNSTTVPITYVPLAFSYNASLPDKGGITQFSAGVNLAFRGVGTNEGEFEFKTFQSKANYLYATLGVQRTQTLPHGMGLFMKVDGQAANESLIDNEQYVAGGMESVRGYREDEAAGDDAVHGTVELSFPDPLEKSATGKWLHSSPFIFYDIADLTIQNPLPGQMGSIKMEGVGAGMRGSITKNAEYEVDWALALDPTDQIHRDDQRIYFKLKATL
ncbi:MAG: BamA/TamA family outer membrane protein [Nitrospiraceae bacterium]|nr:BamA/TamA family outer membrane protein [Nitrospiraceae bacterium]